MTKTKIRAALRGAFGVKKYRLTREGEIHVYGRMPNSTAVGWYLYGWLGDAQTIARIKQLA